MLEAFVFCLLMAANLGLGLRFSFRRGTSAPDSTAGEVFLGSRTLRSLPLALSVVASMVSSTGLIGFTAHLYAFGFHILWTLVPLVAVLPLATELVVPVFYTLRITSVFQYLRMRFNSCISLTACVSYVALTQSVGAVVIFAASIAIATVFSVPLTWCSLGIGLCGTLYTTLGGMRGVVWTDCMQVLFILLAPATVIGKVIYDARSGLARLRPWDDLDFHAYALELDIGNDENVWSTLLATTAINIYRTSFDQVVVQRYIASRTLKEARRTAVVGLVLTTFMYLAEAAMALALTLWFRGCDPESMGQIQKLDQILPFYVKTYLVQFPGTVGLFLSGIVSAATSTISSLINSQAAILYVDVVSPQLPISEVHVARITKCIAFVVGVVMTIYSTLVPYMGSITRERALLSLQDAAKQCGHEAGSDGDLIDGALQIFMMANAAISGPLAGLMLMAVIFPFVNAKGAGWATLLAVVYQLWHMWQTLMSDAKPPRMDVTTDFCADNISRLAPLPTPPQESASSLPALGISSYWSSFFSTIATIVIGLLISALTGGRRSCRKNIPYTNTTCLILWERAGLLPSEVQVKTACSEDTKEGSLMLDTHQEDIAANNETGV